jgi:GTPase
MMHVLQKKTRAVLVGVGLQSDPFSDIKQSLLELEELAITAGTEVVGNLVQSLHRFNPGTLIGSGKVIEIHEMVKETGADLCIVDHQLTGVQARNLEKSIGCPVLDRTQLILDIFAQRAQTHEGQLQVELAQMLDNYSRMVGAWQGSLSRQGGGIGTRGPGEKAIEADRRVIRKRITKIRKDLEDVRQNRSLHRSYRRRNQVPSCALIGYTNSGKSTLLNALTNSQVYTENKLFATLDPTTRKVYLPEGPPATLTDTVGFIRKLPTKLIEAFKATLEEADEAEVILHVVDLSSGQMDVQMKVVEDLIQEFKWDKKPIIHVFNKIDVAPPGKAFKVQAFPRVFVSAVTGEGIAQLKRLLADTIKSTVEEVQMFFPKADEHKIYELGRETHIMRQEPASTGTVCYAYMTANLMTKWRDYLVKNQMDDEASDEEEAQSASDSDSSSSEAHSDSTSDEGKVD